MNKEDRGLKHVCPDCATKYYDLKMMDVVCPKCGVKPLVKKLPRAQRPVRKASIPTYRRYP